MYTRSPLNCLFLGKSNDASGRTVNKTNNELTISTNKADRLMAADVSQVLVVDIQKRLAPVTVEPDQVIRQAGILLRAAKTLDIPHTVSEQYPQGLGATVDDIAALADPARIFDKVHFSCQADDRLAAVLAAQNRPHVIVCGMEAHVCVLQSVLELLAAQYHVWVVADAVTSRTTANRALALERMGKSGANIVSTEMVVFEWLRTAGHPDFRDVSALIK